MYLPDLIKNPQWQQIQLYWESLSALADQGEAGDFLDEAGELIPPPPVTVVNWNKLRLVIDRRLNELQSLVLKQIITQNEREIIQQLVHRRFDQTLARQNRQRQQRHQQYNVAPDPYTRPLYSRYHATREVEEILLNQKKLPAMKELLTTPVFQHILEDANMELVEQYARQLPVQEKEDKWPIVLGSVVALSCNAIPPDQAIAFVLDLLNKEEAVQLAVRVLQSSPFERSLESALRVLEQDAAPAEVLLGTVKRLLERDLSYALQKKIFQFLLRQKIPASLETILAFVSSPTSDYEQKGGGQFQDVREAAILALESFKGDAEQTKLVQALQTGLSQKKWGEISQLTAIKVLVSFGVHVGFDIAITALQMSSSKDYLRIQELAAETLVALADRRAIPFLLSALNEVTKSETVIERWGGAFQKEKQHVVDKLCHSLQQLSVLVAQDLVTGEWFQENV